MAVIICKTHGRSFCYAVCPHIIEDKENNRKPQKILTMRFNFGNFAGHEDSPMIYPFNYCQRCIELHNFPGENFQYSEENLSLEEFDKKFEYVNDKFRLVCSGCYEGYMKEGKNFHL